MAVWDHPTMTNTNAPSPYVVSAHDDFAGGAWFAMNGNPGQAWWGWYAVGGWWKIYVGTSGVAIDRITIQNVTGKGFHDFKFQGSTNDADWNDIYTGHAENDETVQEYTFSLSNVYNYFRFLIVTGYSGSYINVWKLELSGFDAVASQACYLHARRDRMNTRGVSTQNILA